MVEMTHEWLTNDRPVCGQVKPPCQCSGRVSMARYQIWVMDGPGLDTHSSIPVSPAWLLTMSAIMYVMLQCLMLSISAVVIVIDFLLTAWWERFELVSTIFLVMLFSYLLDQVNGWLKVQTEINELPLDSFPLVFLLLENEHLNNNNSGSSRWSLKTH